VIARDAGGWASAAMVDEIYGHVDVHDSAFNTALRTAWDVLVDGCHCPGPQLLRNL